MSSPTQAPPPIKGSWEDLIEQAFHLDENRNEEALPIYQKLITRLLKMPEAKRKDRGDRLQRILETSCFRSANLNSSLERFDESIKNLDILYDVVPDDENKRHVIQAKIRTLQMMDRHDDAIAIVRDTPPREDDPTSQVVQEFGINLDAVRLDEAQRILALHKETLDSDAHRSVRSEAQLNLDLAQCSSMSSILALELNQWEEGIQGYQKAKEYNDELQQEGDYLLYSNLVHRGQPELALPIIEGEPVIQRRKFWQGLAHSYMGKTEEAQTFWEEAAALEIDEESAHAYIDIILVQYYLGDKERIGLEMIMRMLKEMENPSWQLLYFAAIGWAMRNNETNTKVNLEHSIDHFRRQAIGRHLPWTLWPPVRDLLSPEMQDVMRPYFDEKDLKHYFGI